MYKKGDKVIILNQASGTREYFVEGEATVVDTCDAHNTYRVRFPGETDSYFRVVVPEAQDDPKAYCDKLNAAHPC